MKKNSVKKDVQLLQHIVPVGQVSDTTSLEAEFLKAFLGNSYAHTLAQLLGACATLTFTMPSGQKVAVVVKFRSADLLMKELYVDGPVHIMPYYRLYAVSRSDQGNYLYAVIKKVGSTTLFGQVTTFKLLT